MLRNILKLGVFLALSPCAVFMAYGETDISGRVTDPQDGPVSDVRAQLLDKAGDSISTTVTNHNGYFHFAARQPATYTVKVNASNFQQVTRRVRAAPEHTVTADLQLDTLAEKQDIITVTAM